MLSIQPIYTFFKIFIVHIVEIPLDKKDLNKQLID